MGAAQAENEQDFQGQGCEQAVGWVVVCVAVWTVGVGRHACTKVGRKAASRTAWMAGQESKEMSLNGHVCKP